jgi:hypothetical protein
VQGVLEGFATIGAIIGLGFLLAHVGVLDAASQVALYVLVATLAWRKATGDVVIGEPRDPPLGLRAGGCLAHLAGRPGRDLAALVA